MKVAFAMLLCVSLVGCVPWELSQILDGPQGKALAISPSSTVLQAGSTLAFAASGGVPPYAYVLVSGGGSVDPVTGVYTASVSAGTAVVRVTDKTGRSKEATITILTYGALAISPSAVSVVAGNSVTFSPIGGTPPYTFSMQTSGSGSPSVASPSGVYTAGASPGTDVVRLTDSAAGTATATITVTAVSSPVDYAVSGTSLPASGTVAAAVPGGATFTLQNIGSGNGSQTVSWEMYLSLDAALGGGDMLVGSGSTGALAAGANAPVTVTGTFPLVVSGPWFLIVRISAADDTSPANNTSTASAITLAAQNIDYAVTVVNNTGGMTAGGPIAGNFTIQNIGLAVGGASVTWTAYLSTNTTIDISDTTLATGSVGPLGPGATNGPIGFSGTWPAGTATWYLIVKVSASDDINPANDATASAAVPVTTVSPVYTITSVPVPTGSTAGQAVSGTFTIQNGGTAAGSSSVTWQIYASLGDAVYNAGDILLASGSISGLGIGGSNSPGYGGTWPSMAGTWYIVVRASAADAPVIADAASPPVGVANPPPPNYAVSFDAAIPWSGLVSTLISATGTPLITINNLTGNTGHAAITWAVYLSADNVLDGTDTLLASGSNPPLGALGSVSKSFDATWPAAPGKFYWFIARVSAADDSSPADDVVVSHPVATGDYRYQEGAEANNGNPPPSPPTPSSDTGVTTMVANKTIVIEGVMDAYNAYDTYKFTSTATMSVGMQARWATGFDDLDLYLWDSVGSALNSIETGSNAEPAYGTYDTTSVSARTWYVSAWFYLAGNTSGSTGQKYVILVKGMP